MAPAYTRRLMATVEPGDHAPAFRLPNTDRSTVALSDFRGKRVTLVFIPWAFTGTCQGELCTLRDELADFSNVDGQLVVVTCDARPSLAHWAQEQGYAFPLLSDHWPHGAVSRSYGVFSEELGAAQRATFILDAEGVVRWKVVNGLKDPRSTDEYREVLAGL